MIEAIPTGRSPRTFRKYSNFHDPSGLVLRMLRSGNRAAYAALLRAGLSVGTIPFDWMLQSQERRKLTDTDSARQTHPLLLIVGPPRSGSTLLYQTLARYLDVSYLSNLTALFPRSPIAATRLLSGRSQSGGGTFQSYYGQTSGLSAPNDGFEVWNRWLGGNRYATAESLDAATADDMRRFFAAWTTAFNRPFLNKNNRNTHCLQLLADALPTARFVVIRRDPLFVAQSLIEARVRIQGGKSRSWGLASTEHHAEANQPLGYVDDVCDQLLSIEDRLSEQSAGIDPDRLFSTTYEDFCHNPQGTVRSIVNWMPGLSLRADVNLTTLPPFNVSAKLHLSDAEQSRIQQRLELLPKNLTRSVREDDFTDTSLTLRVVSDSR